MKQHFVIFYSPGTFFTEQTRKEVYKWDIDLAQKMAAEIVERHNARPFGFRFSTVQTGRDEIVSPIHYLGGKIETREEIEARNDPSESILRSNMRCNNIKRVIVNTNSWKFTAPLNDDDIVLPTPDWAL